MKTLINQLKNTFQIFVIVIGFFGFSHLEAAEIHVHYDTGFGNSIFIRGDGPDLNWNSGNSASWTAGNDWVYTTSASAGGFEFKPLVNDQNWSTGGNYVVPDGNSIVHIYPFFGASTGQLTIIPEFCSAYVSPCRSLRIYLPPSYNENNLKSYPVLYMHDAQNLFENATSAFGVEWEVDETMDQLIGSGDIKEAIIVGIDNTNNRMSEYTPTWDSTYGGGNGDAYLDFIENDLIPYINTNYRSQQGKDSTYLMGSSLGGLISFYAGWTRPAVYGKVAGMSSSFWWNNEDLTVQVEQYTGIKKDVVFYIDAGGNSDGAPQTNRMKLALENLNYVHGVDLIHWFDPNGSHNEASWAARLNIPLKALLVP